MFRQLLLMSGFGCTDECSGRGECHNGTCLCEIRYGGDLCDGPNLPYHAGIGGGFLLIALVCAIQLIMCVVSEYQRLKQPTFLKACRVTVQKSLYFLIFLATVIRGAYFLSPDSINYGWSNSLFASYYPLLMSGSSLIVCFWAEVFHLRDIRWEKPQFLSKSFLGFVTFNIITYGLLLSEVVITHFAEPPPHDRSFYTHIFNGIYAVLLFVVVIFFLIYGVEVYIKVRGAFVAKPVQIASPLTAEAEPLRSTEDVRPEINNSQLQQSRIGLLSMAFMLIIISGFLFSETLSEFWKTKVPVESRNWHDIIFRLVEIGVAVWFPAVLWNSIQPGELWILNPKKLLAKLEPKQCDIFTQPECSASNAETDAFIDKDRRECWICYESEKQEPLIQPCDCTGDVSSVHHECLRRWLVESLSSSSDNLKCKVCNCAYDVRSSTRLDWERGFTAHHWGSTAVIITCLCLGLSVSWIVIQMFDGSYIRMTSASFALLIIYICVKFLGQNTVNAYQRAKVGAMSIGNHVSTISASVNVDVPKSAPTAL